MAGLAPTFDDATLRWNQRASGKSLHPYLPSHPDWSLARKTKSASACDGGCFFLVRIQKGWNKKAQTPLIWSFFMRELDLQSSFGERFMSITSSDLQKNNSKVKKNNNKFNFRCPGRSSAGMGPFSPCVQMMHAGSNRGSGELWHGCPHCLGCHQRFCKPWLHPPQPTPFHSKIPVSLVAFPHKLSAPLSSPPGAFPNCTKPQDGCGLTLGPCQLSSFAGTSGTVAEHGHVVVMLVGAAPSG